MKQKVKIVTITLIISLLLVYIGFAAMYYPKKNAQKHCSKMLISVMDSTDIQFITREDIWQFIKNEGLYPVGKPMDSIDLRLIEKKLQEITFVKRSETYKTHQGTVQIEIWQRAPLFRVMSGNRQYYVYTKDNNEIKTDNLPFGTMPTVYKPRHGDSSKNSLSKPYYTLIVTGAINPDFLPDLYNFVLFLQTNPFWNALVEQINVTPANDMELVSKIGSPIIILGKLDNFEEKLEKLKTVYEQGLYKINWEQYSHINLRYKAQVIGIKKVQHSTIQNAEP